MTPERLTELINAYGSDPRRWPEAERKEAEALLLRSPDARRVQAAARALDDLLDTVAPTPAGETLRRRIQDRVSPSAPVRQFQSWWPQVAALVAAVVLGFLIGATVLPPPTDEALEVEASDWLFGTGVTEGWDR
jgi:hypothetical protein